MKLTVPGFERILVEKLVRLLVDVDDDDIVPKWEVFSEREWDVVAAAYELLAQDSFLTDLDSDEEKPGKRRQ